MISYWSFAFAQLLVVQEFLSTCQSWKTNLTCTDESSLRTGIVHYRSNNVRTTISFFYGHVYGLALCMSEKQTVHRKRRDLLYAMSENHLNKNANPWHNEIKKRFAVGLNPISIRVYLLGASKLIIFGKLANPYNKKHTTTEATADVHLLYPIFVCLMAMRTSLGKKEQEPLSLGKKAARAAWKKEEKLILTNMRTTIRFCSQSYRTGQINLVFHSPCTTLPLCGEDRMRLNNAKQNTLSFVLRCLRLSLLCDCVAKIGFGSEKLK